MKTKLFLGYGLLLAVAASGANWPAWRCDGTGVAPEKKAPVKWSTNENIRWRAELPGPGNSSPIVWNNKVFITQADGERRDVMCFDRKSGKLLWRKGTTSSAKEATHEANPYGSSTPVTDGKRVIAWFGSAGLICFDMDGKELWRRDTGKQEHMWGYGSSPVLYEDLCILQFGPGPGAALIAVNKSTGENLWRVELPEKDPEVRYDGFAGKKGQPLGSWSTPLVVKSGKRDELVLSIVGELRGFDPKTGRQLWRADGLSPLIYTSPVASDGVIVGVGGFMGSTVAIRSGGSGDLSNDRLWFVQREKKNRISTGVVSKGHLFLCNMDGIAQCIELKSGIEKWSERLKGTGPSGEIWGSMVLAGDNIYVVNQSGDTFVLKADPLKLELVSVNPLKDKSNSTPAVSNGEIFIRTYHALWCIDDK
jgi:outer membrane protein assembly factor BamB